MRIKVLSKDAIICTRFLDEDDWWYDEHTADNYPRIPAQFNEYEGTYLFVIGKNFKQVIIRTKNFVYTPKDQESAVRMFEWQLRMLEIGEMTVEDRNAFKNFPSKFCTPKQQNIKNDIWAWEQIFDGDIMNRLHCFKIKKEYNV